MEPDDFLMSALAIHGLLFAGAVVAIHRVGAYSMTQRILQVLIALVVPLFGAALVIGMAREALAKPEGPDESRFDRNYTGSD